MSVYIYPTPEAVSVIEALSVFAVKKADIRQYVCGIRVRRKEGTLEFQATDGITMAIAVMPDKFADVSSEDLFISMEGVKHMLFAGKNGGNLALVDEQIEDRTQPGRSFYPDLDGLAVSIVHLDFEDRIVDVSINNLSKVIAAAKKLAPKTDRSIRLRTALLKDGTPVLLASTYSIGSVAKFTAVVAGMRPRNAQE